MRDVGSGAEVGLVQVGGQGRDADLHLALVPVRHPAQPQLPAHGGVLGAALVPVLFTASSQFF